MDAPEQHLLGELSCDEIVRGQLRLWQPKVGYRFSIDPLLLADFAGQAPCQRVVDIGAGSGIVGLLLAKKRVSAAVSLVELQPRLAAICRKNIVENGLTERCRVVEGDVLGGAVKAALPGAGFDLVVSCPPYYRLGQGGVNPDGEAAIARHELHLPLPDLIAASRRLVMFRGRVCVVYPTPRLPELLAALVAEGLTPTRLRVVFAHHDDEGQRVLVEGKKGAKSTLRIEPPLVLRHRAGEYTDEAKRILGDKS